MVHIVIGGCSYIGIALILRLLSENQKVICIDDYSVNSSTVFSDVSNKDKLTLQEHFEYKNPEKVDAIYNCGGYRSIPESFKNPLLYYDNNINSLLKSLKLSEDTNCSTFVYLSSAAVYGRSGVSKESDTCPLSPLGKSHLICEQIISDFSKVHLDKSFYSLRLFNVYGGNEISKKPLTNLFSRLYESVKNRTPFKLYGNLYQTCDGTCIRDFIYISDVITSIAACINHNTKGSHIFNIGTGRAIPIGYILGIFKQVYPHLQIEIAQPRKGDIPVVVADMSHTFSALKWIPVKGDIEINRVVVSQPEFMLF